VKWSLFDRPWVVLFFAFTLLINQTVQNNSMTTTGGAKYVFVKNGRDAKRSTLISILGYLMLAPVWMIPAIASTFFHPDLASQYPMLNNPNEAAYVAIAQTLLPTGLMGVLVCAIFAATLTSINTIINVSSGAFVRNFYIRIVNPNASESNQILVGRIFILLYGVLMVFVALYFKSLKSTPLFDLLLIAAASVGIPSTVPLFFGIFVKKTPAWSGWTTAVFGFIIAIILRIILSDEFISSLFARGIPYTGQELNDLNIAITTGFLFVTCTAWYFSSVLFYRKDSKEYVQQVDSFFAEMKTPIDMEEEHLGEHESDSRQYGVLGRLCLIYGGFVMLLNLIPNTWESRLYISFCGLLILVVGLILLNNGARIKRKIVPV
jgi:Na+/proline symporter